LKVNIVWYQVWYNSVIVEASIVYIEHYICTFLCLSVYTNKSNRKESEIETYLIILASEKQNLDCLWIQMKTEVISEKG